MYAYRVWFYVGTPYRRLEWVRFAPTIREAFNSAREAVLREYGEFRYLAVERQERSDAR